MHMSFLQIYAYTKNLKIIQYQLTFYKRKCLKLNYCAASGWLFRTTGITVNIPEFLYITYSH